MELQHRQFLSLHGLYRTAQGNEARAAFSNSEALRPHWLVWTNHGTIQNLAIVALGSWNQMG